LAIKAQIAGINQEAPHATLLSIVEGRPEDQAQVLTDADLITALTEEGGLVISDTNEDTQDDEADIQENSENMHPKQRGNQFTEYIVPKDKKDRVDEVFNKI